MAIVILEYFPKRTYPNPEDLPHWRVLSVSRVMRVDYNWLHQKLERSKLNTSSWVAAPARRVTVKENEATMRQKFP